MFHSQKLTALLDANVLYPAPLRDYLLHLANLDLYKPKWSDEIQNEWIDNLLLKRTDLTRHKLEKTRDAMNSAFPDSNVINYKTLINGLYLKDLGDRHVLAAAIRANTDVLVTFNLKHFPSDYLKMFVIEPQHPDTFVVNLVKLDKKKAIEALNNQVRSLRNPPKTEKDVLETLKNCGLEQSVLLLKK